MTSPASPPEQDPDTPQTAEQSTQDRDALNAVITAALAAALVPWLASVAAAVLAGGAIAIAAVPLPSVLVARTLTRIRPDVIRLWARTSGRFGVARLGSDGPDRTLQQIGSWIGTADDHAFRTLSALLAGGQAAGWTDQQARDEVRAALGPSSANWQLWTARTADLAAGYAVSAAMAAAVAGADGEWVKTWISRLDSKVRPSHLDAHGQTVAAAGYFLVGGWPMLVPHDPSAPLAETMGCRCEPQYRRVR